MKQFGIAIVLALGLVLAACGGGNSSSSATVTGNWTATLTNTDGTPALFGFTTSLTQSSGTVVTGTNLSFTTSNTCFTSGGSQTGSFVLSGNFNGNITGTFQLTITSGTPPGNTLTLQQGMVNNNTISGTWTLTGTGGCTGAGNFTMTKV
ncbi:MAG TPA: hypothetical protein VN948_19065 [Terriglobales bacterium]|nr:hypothetical protein [Terriglobales bacterium]